MRLGAILSAVALAWLMLTPHSLALSDAQNQRIGLVARDGVVVHSAPSIHAEVMATLVEQTQVTVEGHRGAWEHIVLWGTTRGWTQRSGIVFHPPRIKVSTYQAPAVQYRTRSHLPLPLHTRALVIAETPAVAHIGSATVRRLTAGSRVLVSSWLQDGHGHVWYRVGRLWIDGADVAFNTPPPVTMTSGGRPLWQTIRGKGMWLTLGTVTDTNPDVLVQAATRSGVTHLYVEAAISPLGFHGRDSVAGLLRAAHRAHLAVIAWVYPYLTDIAADVALTREVAGFRSTAGDYFDGIAADLERNIQPWTVRAYSQLVRYYVGNRYLLVGVTYPPQSFPDYPFRIVGQQYNVVAPMDYWHQTKTDHGLNYNHGLYGYGYAYHYASESIATIRHAAGSVQIELIGQTFDDFGRLELGPHAPSGAEVSGFLAACKAAGASGVSFFQWLTATPDEWHAINGFRY